MINWAKIFVILIIITPLVVTFDCSTASQRLCGAKGGACEYYSFFNGTCIAPTECPTSDTITVWSNASFNCVPCLGASQSICINSCAKHNFYFDDDTSIQTCTTCQAEYGASCSKCNSSVCTQCSAGQLANDSKSCVDATCNIAYCVTCQSSKCTKCDQSHKVYNGICVCYISNCQVCGKSFCYKCQNGFNLDSSKLKCSIKCIDNCLTCTSASYCDTCFDGYYYDSMSNRCVPNCTAIDSNCLSCSTTTVCQGCTLSFTLAANGKSCNAACSDSNCNTCTNSSKCQACNAGYRLNSTAFTCEKDICSVVYCKNCETSSTCLTCFDFHKVSTDKKRCLADCGVTNCRFCSGSATCSACIDGYTLSSSGQCSPICSITNCSLCASVSTCFSCSVGFKLSQNNQQCEYDCGIYKCLSCSSTTTCQLCYPGFTLVGSTACSVVCQTGLYLKSSTCQPCPNNCQSCDSQGVCLKCKYLYYLNSTDLTCQPCSTISNCFSCTSESVCQICQNGYYFVNSVCKKITKDCSIANCLVCFNETTCSVCRQKYEVTNGSSACSIIGCKGGQYLVGSTCTCGPKSYVLDGACASCSDVNCLSCTSSVCLQCASGYYRSDTSCTQCSEGCQTCDSTTCSSCKSGFIKKGTTCILPSNNKRKASVSRKGKQINCAAGCKTCDIDSNQNTVCLQADTGYVLIAGVIYKCGGSCLTCSNIANSNGTYDVCLTCPNGYNLIAGTCTQCTGANALTCSISDFAYSLTCLPGYTAVSGTCTACSDNCLKCGSQGAARCDVGGCNFGFFQSKGNYQCIKCFNGCPVCGSDPNECLQCGNYKYLSNKICYSCPSNCLKCTDSTTCTTCISGYGLAKDKTCKILNVNGCTEYDQNITCTNCDQYYTLTNGSCVLNMTCNQSKTCTTCQYNYYVSSGNCLPCPTISNCYSCDPQSSASCIECATGYYLSSSSKSCVKCPDNCLTCQSDKVCTSAVDGYYLVLDVSGNPTGNVRKCGGLCQTCLKDALICLSCQSGSEFVGSQCISKSHYKVSYVGYPKALGQNSKQSGSYQVGFFVGLFAKFLREFAVKLGFSSFEKFTQNSNVGSLKYQSVAMELSTNAEAVGGDPATLLKNAQFTEVGLVSLSVSSNNVQDSNVNLGLVLGVAIPLGILLIVIIIMIGVKNSKMDSEEKVAGDSQKDLDKQAEAI